MASLSLAAEARNTEEKTAQIRKDKKIPAVVYGKNTESTSITIDYSEFLKTFRQA
jgi:ribosomal protein L25 (general stress protein Ctc)